MGKQIAAIVGKVMIAFLLAFALTIGLMIPVVLFAGGAVALEGEPLSFERMIEHPVFVFGSMVTQGLGFIGATLLMYQWFDRRKGWTLGWKQRKPISYLGVGAVSGVGMITVVFVLLWMTQALQIDGVRTGQAVWMELLLYALLFALVALNEELFSRGYVQGLVRYRFGPTAAIVASSLFFSLLHMMNPGALDHPLPLLNIVLAGVLFAVAREVTHGLWFPIGLHWTWNFTQGNLLGFEVSGLTVQSLIEQHPIGSVIWSGSAFGAEGSLATTIVLLLGILVLARRKQRDTLETVRPDHEA